MFLGVKEYTYKNSFILLVIYGNELYFKIKYRCINYNFLSNK